VGLITKGGNVVYFCGSRTERRWKNYAKNMPVIRKLIKFTHSFCLTVPDEIRHHLGVNKGDYLVWNIGEKGRVYVDKLTKKEYPGFFVPGTGFVRNVR